MAPHVPARERPWWPTAVTVGVSLASSALAVALCLSVSERNANRGIQQREQIKATAAQQHEALCALLVALDDNARDVPPATKTGIANARTYASLRVSQGCPPRTGD